MGSRYIPSRGDIAWIHFEPRVGHEQAGHRPALVLSPSQYNGPTGMAIACPITSREKGLPFEVRLPENLAVAGFVLADQVKNIDWKARKAQFACRVAPSFVSGVVEQIETLLNDE
jgi:mRNA interferase MazF